MTQQEWIEDLMARAKIPRPCRNQQEWEDRVLAVMGVLPREAAIDRIKASMFTDASVVEELADVLMAPDPVRIWYSLTPEPKICTLCHQEIRSGHCNCV